jgi:CBS domain containing-hemolysin-like protein
MFWLVLAITLTLTISFVCSLFEAFTLSTTVAEIESLKKTRPRRGALLETMKQSIDETISAILTLNTIANGLGSVVIGAVGAHVLGSDRALALLTIAFGAVLLVAAEVLPKNIGVVYRRALQPHLVYPLWWTRRVLSPITWACNAIVRRLVRPGAHGHSSDEEILLLAERGARSGALSQRESNIIVNALTLDDVRVSQLMTPRTVVTAFQKNTTVGDLLRDNPTLQFGRVPVYDRNLDDIVGLVRRRELLQAKAAGRDAATVESLMHEVQFVPETATVANAMQVCLKTHQRLLVAVDEFGATAGVLTMEDIVEHLIGGEIFEKGDVAVDMRELARAKLQKAARPRRAGEAATAVPMAPKN